MTKQTIISQQVRHGYKLLPWLFLLVALPLTYLVWHEARDAEYAGKENVFQIELSDTTSQLSSAINIYEQALYGMRSLFYASEFVSEHEFELFVYEMLNASFATGLSQVGFVKRVDPMQPKSYRRLGAHFQKDLLQLDQQALHAPLIYLVSKQTFTNQAVLFDAFADPQLRTDLEQAAKHNQILFSAPIGRQQQADSARHMSLLLPVYADGGKHLVLGQHQTTQ